MAPLDALLPHIYHERQQEGSMLCAEHALNNLFRAFIFTLKPSASSKLTLSLPLPEGPYVRPRSTPMTHAVPHC